MADANDEAAMREFIQERGLTDAYETWLREREERLSNLSKPEVWVDYTFEYDRSSRDETINITPWLKTATPEDFRRLMAIEDEHVDADHADHSFVDAMVVSVMDAEEEERHFLSNSEDNTTYLTDVREKVMKHIEAIRPDDHAVFKLAA